MRDAELVSLVGPLRVVAVAVVDHLEVLLEHLLRDGDGVLPASIALRNLRNFLAVSALSTVLTMETFCEEPTARNSKRWPP